jgi:type VI secretion system secreted protein VgrG
MNLQNLSLDFRTFVLTAGILSALFALFLLVRSVQRLIGRGNLRYSRLRQRQSVLAWRNIWLSIIILLFSAWIFIAGEQTIYRFVPVTPTSSPTTIPSLTPTLTLSPTIMLTPSETPTLEFTYTPSPSAIPLLPNSISSLFESVVTPSEFTSFSALTFSRGLDLDTYNLEGVNINFENPVNQIFATFSYNQMQPGVQWTAIWYRQGELVYFETLIWDGGTGGLGFTEWSADAEEWTPGIYQVQIFVGEQVAVVQDFFILGEPLASTPTPSPTPTATPTFTPTQTATITPTHTRFPTSTTAP